MEVNITDRIPEVPVSHNLKCKMCNQYKKLIDSHIIPKSFYSNQSRVLVGKNSYPKRRPIGTYDSKILCADCDNFLGNLYDDVAYEILVLRKGLNKIVSRDSNSSRSIVYYNLKDKTQYDKIVKFFISLIWRMSISQHEDFENFNLGPYEAIALKAITMPDFNWKKYFSLCLCSFEDSDVLIQLVTPQKIRIQSINFIPMIVGSIKAFIKIDKRPLSKVLNFLEVSEKSDFLMVETRFSRIKEYADIVKLAQKMEYTKTKK